MKLMKYEIRYENINMDKLQQAYDELKDSLNIEAYLLSETIDDSLIETYLNIKSWRSNALEGNTTKLKNLKKIIEAGMKDNSKEDVDLLNNAKTDEESEIVNLVKAYEINVKYNLGSLENVNYILGANIEHNDFKNNRGKLKQEENVIEHAVQEELTLYEVNFSKPSETKNEIKLLLDFLKNNLKEKMSFSNAFVLATIFNIEFNRIHPFADGNGRTGRLFMEKIFEQNDFVPLIFAREDSKKLYKETLFATDKMEDKYNYEFLIKVFSSIYNDEVKELVRILNNTKWD